MADSTREGNIRVRESKSRYFMFHLSKKRGPKPPSRRYLMKPRTAFQIARVAGMASSEAPTAAIAAGAPSRIVVIAVMSMVYLLNQDADQTRNVISGRR